MTPREPNERWKWLRELAISVAIVAALLAGIELLLRSHAAYDALPLAKPYYSYDVTRRLHALEDLQEQRGEIDVLFLGSSAVRASTDPVVFDRTYEKVTGRKMLSFNGGFSSMFPSGTRLYLESVWRRVAKPRYVLQGVRPLELTNAWKSATYLQGGLIEPLWLDETWPSSFEAWLLGGSRLLQYRGTLLKSIQRLEAGAPLHVREPGEIVSDARGYRRESVPLAMKRKGRSKRLWRYEKAPRAEKFDKGLDMLSAMKATCDAMGATFVVYHLPEHPERFGLKQGSAMWRTYQRVLRKWAEQNKVPFLDITDGDFNTFGRDEYYSDYHHMHGRGADHFSKLLARRFAERFTTAR